MAQRWFFLLGLANNLLLVVVFLLRREHLAFLQRYGWMYLLLALPAVYTLRLVQAEPHAAQLTVFLCLFLAFLALEGLLEFVFTVPFRQDWRWLGPYVALYLATSYGFVVMTWKHSRLNGAIMLAACVAQLVANMRSH